jgi:hypothetical protein
VTSICVSRAAPELRAGLLAGFQRAPGLHQRFLEGAPDGHHLAHRLHLRAQRFVGAGKLFKLPLGNLDHDVIDRRLEAGRRLARDVVGNLVERVAHGQLGGDLGDGKPVAFEASAEERETRGFISITVMRPSTG